MNTNLANVSPFIDNLPLDQCLDVLCKYGEPRLGKYNSGWYCSIEVFVTGNGVKFEVKTDFSQKTSTEAANLCLHRLAKALDKIRKGGDESIA